MQEKEIVTYIKSNNEEKIIELNFFNRLKTRKKIFLNAWNSVEIKDDIKYIHFQNSNLPKLGNRLSRIEGITCSDDTTCIIENCKIEDTRTYSVKSFSLSGENFQLININPESSSIAIKPKYCHNLIIDNQKIDNPTRKIKVYSLDDCDTIELEDNKSLNEIYIKCNDASLSGTFLLDIFYIISENKLKIGNQKEPTTIIMTEEKYPEITLSGTHLELNNCTILNDSTKPIRINYQKLTTNNFVIKAKGKVIINGVVFSKKDANGYVVVTDKDLLRLELSNQLFKRLSSIEQQINSGTKKYLPQHQNKKLIYNIVKQKMIIKREQDVLEELQEELKNQEFTRKTNIVKSLKKKPVKYFRK